MFKLKFPSGATIEFKGGFETCGTDRYEGTLYIWPEDLEPLLDTVMSEILVVERERSLSNDSKMPRTDNDRSRNRSGNVK